MTDIEIQRLMKLLAVPSISAMPQHADDMKRAAAMVAEEVRLAGGTAEVIVTSGHPLVVGEVHPSNENPDAPVVLIYGHYDVQPPGDPSLWTSPAFEPTIRGDNLYCRGASDDKGNLFMLLVALQRMRAQGRLHVRARVLVDGEEESGGHSAVDWVAADPRPPRAAIIFDSPMVAPGQPAVCTGLRGLAYFRVKVRGAAADLHSGMHGGAAMNAAHVLMAMLAAVMPVDGRVPAPLAEGVMAPTQDEAAAWETLPTGADILVAAGGRPADRFAAGEYHLRTTMLPAVDVHGIRTGNPNVVATAIPATAEATLSIRIPPGASADHLAAVLEAMLRDAAPEGCDVEIDGLGVAGASRIDPDDPVIRAAMAGIEVGTGMPATPVGIGGSIPVVAAMAARGTSVVLSGFALPDDGYHSPDEHLRVSHLELGVNAAIGILDALALLASPGH